MESKASNPDHRLGLPASTPSLPRGGLPRHSGLSPSRAELGPRQAEPTATRGEIELLRAELLEARKQATLGELLGTTTHEFNNALTTILNYARLGLRHRDQATRDMALERIH